MFTKCKKLKPFLYNSELNSKFRKMNNAGFSLMEVMLALVVGSVVLIVSAQSLVANVDSYNFVTKRKSSLADARSAINQIRNDFLKIDQSGNGPNVILDIGTTSISFIDDNGETASYRLSTYGNGLALYKTNSLLIESVDDFSLTYYDQDGEEIDPTDADDDTIASVKRIKISIETAADGNEGNVSLSTLVTPRDFIGYTNYE